MKKDFFEDFEDGIIRAYEAFMAEDSLAKCLDTNKLLRGSTTPNNVLAKNIIASIVANTTNETRTGDVVVGVLQDRPDLIRRPVKISDIASKDGTCTILGVFSLVLGEVASEIIERHLQKQPAKAS